jgi:hypothetical protein
VTELSAEQEQTLHNLTAAYTDVRYGGASPDDTLLSRADMEWRDKVGDKERAS